MAEMLELSNWGFKTTMINMLGFLMEEWTNKVSMDNVSREIETQRNNQRKCWKSKHCDRNEECL